MKKYTEKTKPPRNIYLRWPFGHPFGKPFNIDQQRAVLSEAFKTLYYIKEPGKIIDVHFEWKKHFYIYKSMEELKTILQFPME